MKDNDIVKVPDGRYAIIHMTEEYEGDDQPTHFVLFEDNDGWAYKPDQLVLADDDDNIPQELLEAQKINA